MSEPPALATRRCSVAPPAMAMPDRSRMSSASISARGITGTSFSRAATTSTLSFFTAEEITTTWGEVMFSARWPMEMVMPIAWSRFVVSDSFRSEPVTSYPRFARTSAMPDMPTPPIPIKCMVLYLSNMSVAFHPGHAVLEQAHR